MSILIRNVRGLNKDGREKDVCDHIQKLSPSIVALVETKVKLSKLISIKTCVPKSWMSCNNFHLSFKGRIWISWNPIVWSCSVIAISSQHITISVKNQKEMEGHITVVYGLNAQGERDSLWKELTDLQLFSTPWLVTGDFNTSRFIDEKVGGRSLTFSH